VLSSKNEGKQEARFATRLDVLNERLDTLASTVATTASAMAGKDGEIAALRRDLEARDQELQALTAQVRQAGRAPVTDASVDATELRSLKNAVAGLMKERAEGGSAQLEELTGTVHSLARRVEELSASVSERPADRPSEELVAMLATLRSQVEALGGLRSGRTDEQLEQRVATTDEAVESLSRRLDTLAETVEAAAAGLSHKEDELATLHRDFTDASTRIEVIVDDIREALHALGDPGPTPVDDLTERLERVETVTRTASESSVRSAAELSSRIDVIDRRVATVAEEVSRAKTLWPVALRSLEARLDDAVHGHRVEDQTDPVQADQPSDDLLAGLRDSLQAMESVAAEMARASETLGDPAEEPPAEEPAAEESSAVAEPASESEPQAEAQAAASGATIVPLRAGEP
jgi:predicted  nucleic acid-binding Zn-ribbon protein